LHVKTAGAIHDGKTGDTAFIQKILERAATRFLAREKNGSPDHCTLAQCLRYFLIKDNPGELFQKPTA